MEPIEINAGNYYLRALRADDRIDDRQAIAEAFADEEIRTVGGVDRIEGREDAGAYVRRRADEWADDVRCSWAVADPLTGQLLGEVGLARVDEEVSIAEASCWTHPAHRRRGVAGTALAAALRFGFGGLALRRIYFRHVKDNTAAAKVAEKCGFTREERSDGQVWVWVLTAPSPTG